ncbi:MAG: glycosyltransferase family 2 protein [Eubacteriales bacterium]|nr:glycosyltransferase family 2 protein [Eubacteriales bacterium]
MNPVYSVIIPCYNEEAVIDESYKRLSRVMKDMAESYELVFVNDGSKDKTEEKLNAIQSQDKNVKVVHFARNGGHQIAVSAGIDYATGDALVIIDADLQDPPEIIPEMAAKWKEGYDVVYGKRKSRKGESFFKKFTAKTYYKVLQSLAGDIFPRDTGDFRLVDKRVADVIRNMPEHARYLRGMFAWAGFKQCPVEFERQERFAGETHYPLKKMIKLAMDGIISFSDKPLMLPLFLGIFFLLTAGIAFIASLIAMLFGVYTTPFVWLAELIIFIGGLILLSMGIQSRYMARIYEEVKFRPLYVVRETRGFEEDTK